MVQTLTIKPGKVRRQQFDDVRFFGGTFQEIENAFKAADYEPVLRKFLGVLEEAHREYFARQAGPSGADWPDLAPATIVRKGHSRILFETGKLSGSLGGRSSGAVRETTHRGAIFGTSVPYSIFHQQARGFLFGGNLPQREHVGMTEQTLDVLLQAVADQTVEFLKG